MKRGMTIEISSEKENAPTSRECAGDQEQKKSENTTMKKGV